jgi:hypothetical protein
VLLDDLMNDVGLPMLAGSLGESITYFPGHGASRTVAATAILRSSRLVQNDEGIKEVDEARVLVARTAAGIADPRVGHAIRLPEDNGLYSFDDEMEDVLPGSWWLIFSRPKMIRQGAAQTMDK